METVNKEKKGVEKKTVALLSNVTVDLIIGKLRKKYNFYIPEGYDTWIQEVINTESALYKSKHDAVIILLDGTEARSWKCRESREGKDEGTNEETNEETKEFTKEVTEGFERINLWKQAVTALTENITFAPIFISTIDIRANRIKSYSECSDRFELENNWNSFIKKLVTQKNNVFILDIADVIAELGRKQFYSNKMWYVSNMPYSRDGLLAVSREIDRALSAAFETRKKIIALDLDNTLWGGIIGEDGIEGIELSAHKEGQRYYDFQRQFLEMKNRGILLALNSKNNPEDTEEAIQHHPAMLLSDKDFVSKKINWESKAKNIYSMKTELNLTEGSFIFVDDNELEREAVRIDCPEVLVPEFPTDTTELLPFAEEIWFDYCKPLRVLDEDANKTQMYQAEAKRTEAKQRCDSNNTLDLDSYIKKLEISIDIHRMRSNEFERTVQLINKTNQFNLTTKRYTHEEVQEIIENPNNIVYVVHSSDKYGDNGLISVVILRNNSNESQIDTFLMSCRVMGRKIENVIVAEIAKRLSKKALIGEYIPTAKNKPVRELYERLGFDVIVENEDHKLYRLNVLSDSITPDSITASPNETTLKGVANFKSIQQLEALFKEIKFDEN